MKEGKGGQQVTSVFKGKHFQLKELFLVSCLSKFEGIECDVYFMK